jgi:uncharacterized repeat protein (TIGR03803 family)
MPYFCDRGKLVRLFMFALCGAAISVAHAQSFKILSHQIYFPWTPLIQGLDGNFYGATDASIYSVSPEGKLAMLNFQPAPWGLVLATDGNFYGTNYTNGLYGNGNIYRLTPTGVTTTLHDFHGPEGALPDDATLVQGTDGSLYGTTTRGGAYDFGAAYKITLTGVYTKLADFTETEAYPSGALIQGTDGNFYGVTGGNVFKMTPTGTLTTLHTLPNTSIPYFGVIQASNGKLYGTTAYGGASNYGMVFEVTTTGAFTTLHSFDGTDGEDVYSGLMQATNGNLYGTTSAGGAYGRGTIFEITIGGTFTTIHNFCELGTCSDGATPRAGLFQATDGSLYGTTLYGGPYDDGTIFSLSLGLEPFVQTVPGSGPVGTPVTILGTDLTGASSVSFNGTPSAFDVVSATQITTTVPAGATTGKIEVVTPSATLYTNLANFRVTPVISGFSPTSGPTGTVVVITGEGLLNTSRVTFYKNAVVGSFTVNSDTQITVTVPPGAATGPIQITTPGGTVTSNATFTVN